MVLKVRTYLVIFLIMFLILFSIKNVYASEKEESHWEFWHTEKFSHNFNAKLSGTLETEYKYHKGLNYYKHVDFLFDYRFSKRFVVGGGYRNILYQDGSSWQKEDRPYFHLTPKIEFGNFKLSCRNKVEYRSFLNKKMNKYRYRNQLNLTYPIKIDSSSLEPYISNEIFIDLTGPEKREVSRNRFSIGIQTEIFRNGKLDCYYLHQSNEKDLEDGEIWYNFKVFGVKLKITF